MTLPDRPKLNAAIVVAHPDDETLWAGGLVLTHADWNWFIVTLCRAGDPDRAPKFFRVLDRLGARGAMADLEDDPDQLPLPDAEVRQATLALLPPIAFDVVLTHGPSGEYTRHRRHEEVCRAVIALCQSRQIVTRAVWLFAYEDGRRQYLPRAQRHVHWCATPPEAIWQEKYRIITELYGFRPESWEARTTPRTEAFWRFAGVDLPGLGQAASSA